MKLEYGKRYVLRNGWTTSALVKSICSEYPFRADSVNGGGPLTWDVNGAWGEQSSGFDIVSEYCESVCEEPAPEPRKLQWVPGRTYKMRNGGLVFVILVDEGQSYPVTGFRLYPGEDAEQFPNTWTIHGKRHMGHVESSFDIVDYAYEVGETDANT